MKRYSNQNHGVNRNFSGFQKTASIYEQQGLSNRIEEKRALTFSSLAPFQSEAILSTMRKEASALEGIEFNKEASVISNPFEAFGQARHYISSKLGVAGEVAHDLASSVVARAQDIQSMHGGEVEPLIAGIVDHMDHNEVHSRIGAAPMRKLSPNELEEKVKEMLIEQMQMTAYQADQFKKIIIQQAKNLSTQYRTHDLSSIAFAIVSVLVDHQDASIAYGISSSDRLKDEIEHHLNRN